MASSLGKVLIGGGSGFIGKNLVAAFRSAGYDVVIISRKPQLNSLTWEELVSRGLPEKCTAVINVAGQNVLDPTRRWTPGFKQNVFASRVNTTRTLAEAIKSAKIPPKVFATISGVGYYEPSKTAEYTELSPGGTHDFLAQLCVEWEKAGDLPKELDVRRVVVRSGVVLGRKGGMINNLILPFYFGLGGPVGSGSQFMPWIHIKDIVGIFLHAVENDNVTGVLNGVAPHIITNLEFSKSFGQALWRPAIFKLPVFLLDLAFSKERAKIMTEGQKVIPKRTLESGYIKYNYPDIQSALRECAKLFYKNK